MKKLIALGCVAVACLFAVGCDLDKDKIISDFCSYYPEVCQYASAAASSAGVGSRDRSVR